MGVAPIASMVVIFLPCAAEIGVTHERDGVPSRCTVQAPQSAMPHPNFVPVSPSSSRSTQSRGVSADTSRLTILPLMSSCVMWIFSLQDFQAETEELLLGMVWDDEASQLRAGE